MPAPLGTKQPMNQTSPKVGGLNRPRSSRWGVELEPEEAETGPSRSAVPATPTSSQLTFCPGLPSTTSIEAERIAARARTSLLTGQSTRASGRFAGFLLKRPPRFSDQSVALAA